MRRIIGWVLLALGAFLIVAGMLGQFWAPGVVKKTPLDINSVTHLTGAADKLNPASGEVESLDVKATSVTRADSERSDDEVVVFVSSTCLVIDEGDVPDCVDADDPQGRLINASTDVFATDRKTALAVGGDYLPEGADEHEGLVNKWPFDAEQRDYDYWDGMLGEAVTATFDSVEEIDGLETYKYVVDIPETPAEVVEGIDGLYTQYKEIWVDPVTGSIIRQTQDEQRTTAEGDTILDLQLAFTDDQVAGNVADAQDNIDRLNLITRTVPIVGLLGGVLLILIGAVLAFGRRHKHEA